MGQPALGSARPEASPPPPPQARLTTPPCAARQLSQTRSHVCTQPARGSLDPLLVLDQQVVGTQTINESE